MTKIFFTRKDGRMIGFRLSGHAGCAIAGEDIVCSALSTASQMAVVAITEVAGQKADVQIRDGFLSLQMHQPTHESDLIIDSLYRTLSSIQQSYKKYIKLEVKDV